MKKIICLFFFLLIWNVLVFSAPKVIEYEVESMDEVWLIQCQKLAKKYNGDKRVLLRTGLLLKPDNVTEENGCATLLFRGDKPPDSKKYETGVIVPLYEIESIDGKEMPLSYAYSTLADFYLYKDNNLKKAIEFYEKTLEVDPYNFHVFVNIGAAYNYNGQFQDSIKLGEKATKLYPTIEELWGNLGAAYAVTNNFENAIRCYEQALTLNPQSGEIHANLGVAYLKVGDKNKAKIHLEKAKRILVEKGTSQSVILRLEQHLKSLNDNF